MVPLPRAGALDLQSLHMPLWFNTKLGFVLVTTPGSALHARLQSCHRAYAYQRVHELQRIRACQHIDTQTSMCVCRPNWFVVAEGVTAVTDASAAYVPVDADPPPAPVP